MTTQTVLKAEALRKDFIAFDEAHRDATGIVMKQPYVITRAHRVEEGRKAS